MYHSFGKSKHTVFNNFDKIDPYIHLKRKIDLEEKNIKLIRITDYEWIHYKDQMKNLLNSVINSYNDIQVDPKCVNIGRGEEYFLKKQGYKIKEIKKPRPFIFKHNYEHDKQLKIIEYKDIENKVNDGYRVYFDCGLAVMYYQPRVAPEPKPSLKVNVPKPSLKVNVPKPILKVNVPKPILKVNVPKPILKRLKKYPQNFFNSFNNRVKLKRYYHRLVAWYILNKFGEDTYKGMYFFIKYLSKHVDIKRAINSTFPELKLKIEKEFKINIGNQLKHELIDGCYICPNCAKRLKPNYKFCSSSCANSFKLKDPDYVVKISESLKNYYNNTDCSERYKKISNTLNDMYSNMTRDEIRKKCTNKTIEYTAYDDFSKNFKGLRLDCTKEFFYTNKNIPIICKCGNKFTSLKSTAFYPYCKICNPTQKHKTQNIITSFIRGHIESNIDIDRRSIISPLELDIYVKSKKFAIEYDGLLYHSFGKSKYPRFNNTDENSRIHLKKTELCESKGIQLFHIFENEYTNPIKRRIWNSMILSKLQKSTRVYARKCTVKEISSKETREFLDKNHLQGYTSAKINIALYYNDEIVQIMTFSKPRFNKNYEYELIRMCNTLECTVVGGASKLLKYFERTYKPKSLISYANRRWSTDNVYNVLGFKLDHISDPNYFYFKVNENVLYSRNKFQKHMLKDTYDSNLSESQNMYNNNYRKIFDCGNLVFTKNYKI